MAALVLLALALGFGVAVVRASGARLDGDLAWVAGPVLGLASAFWVVYAWTWIFSGIGAPTIAASAITLGGAIGALTVYASRREQPWPDRPPRWLLVASAPIALFVFALNWVGILRTNAEGGVYSLGNAWADIPFHTSITTSFAYGDNVPPTYPVAHGEPLGYPFLVDFISGVLTAGGLSLRWSVIVVNVLLHLATFMGFMVLVRVLTGSVRAAVLAAYVLLMLGNLGVLTAPGDARAAGGLVEWLRALPWDYTGDSLGTKGRERLGIGVYLGNPTFMFMLPRRSGAFGLAAGMSAFALAAELIRRPAVRTAALLGLLAGLLPRIHAHTAISFVVVVAVWLALERARRGLEPGWLRPWLVAAAVGALVALPQVLAMRGQAASFITPGFLGWTGEPKDAFLRAKDLEALRVLGWFWIVNGGVLTILLPAALVDAPWRARRMYAGFGALWLFGNVVRTQPWEWDNSSYFVWWQAGTVLVVVPLVDRLLQGRPKDWKRPVRTAFGALALTGLVAGGCLSLVRTLQDRPGLWSTRAAQFAQRVRERTPPDAVVLTSNGHGHPVAAISGRHVWMGYWGWLANHGLDAGARELQLTRMLGGDVGLMRRLGIEYALDGPYERGYAAEHKLDLAWLADPSRVDTVLDETVDGQQWRLLKLKTPSSRRPP